MFTKHLVWLKIECEWKLAIQSWIFAYAKSHCYRLARIILILFLPTHLRWNVILFHHQNTQKPRVKNIKQSHECQMVSIEIYICFYAFWLLFWFSEIHFVYLNPKLKFSNKLTKKVAFFAINLILKWKLAVSKIWWTWYCRKICYEDSDDKRINKILFTRIYGFWTPTFQFFFQTKRQLRRLY